MNFIQGCLIELKDFFAGLSVFLSGMALFFANKNWKNANRPILSALVKTNSAGNVAVLYDLIISNTGNRPAKNIRFFLDNDKSVIDFLENQSISEDHSMLKVVNLIFSSDLEIPVLCNNSNIASAFGATSSKNPFWKYGSLIPIKIVYYDFDGKKYVDRQNLMIRDSESFSDYFWGEK